MIYVALSHFLKYLERDFRAANSEKLAGNEFYQHPFIENSQIRYPIF
jgi:hypothetical protein